MLFGGAADARTPLDDTWLYKGGTWTRVLDVGAPSPRHSAAMAFDVERRVVVLHGGLGARSTPLADTWEWDGQSWVERDVRRGPGRRAFHAMAFDEARGVMVLHGGRGDGPLDVTWEWSGLSWESIRTDHSPGVRSDLCMAWVGKSESILLHGGTAGGRSDSWLYDGTDWTLHESVGPAVVGAAMASEPRTGRVILFGGRTAGGDLREAWRFDPEFGWARSCAELEPAPRMRPVLAPGGESGVLLFGGGDDHASCRGDMWEWTYARPGALLLGDGCGAAGRSAALRTTPDTDLRSGGVVALRVETQGGGVDQVRILLGNGRLTRKIDVSGLGDPDCHAWCPVEGLWAAIAVPVRGSGGARFDLPLPADPSIHGLQLIAQAVASVSTAPSDVLLSNGLLIAVGGR